MFTLSDNPKVSIVTPSFNQVRFLEQTIQSVLGQDYLNIEYIIMDGGSTDGSAGIIQRYTDQLAYWQSQTDKGQTDAINQGFARATGEVLAWINSDDLLLPGAISAAVRQLKEHREAGMVYGDCLLINAEGQTIGHFPAAQTDIQRLRRGYVHIPQQAAFFRAELWREVGPLDDSFFFAMDYDLWVRLAQKAPLSYTPKAWAAFRLHDDAKSISADDRCWPEMLKVHYRDGGSRFAPIVAKYWVRKLVQPAWIWYRKQKINR